MVVFHFLFLNKNQIGKKLRLEEILTHEITKTALNI